MTRRSEGRDRLTHELPITVVRIGVDERRADLICRHIEGEEREHAPHLVKGDCGRAVDVEAEEEVFEEDETADILLLDGVGVIDGLLAADTLHPRGDETRGEGAAKADLLFKLLCCRLQ